MQTKIKSSRRTVNHGKTFAASWTNNRREILPVFLWKCAKVDKDFLLHYTIETAKKNNQSDLQFSPLIHSDDAILPVKLLLDKL